MKYHTSVLLGVLMALHAAAMAATEKPPAGSQAEVGAKKPAPRDKAKPREARSPALKDEAIQKKSANKVSRKKEIELNLCDQ